MGQVICYYQLNLKHSPYNVITNTSAAEAWNSFKSLQYKQRMATHVWVLELYALWQDYTNMMRYLVCCPCRL